MQSEPDFTDKPIAEQIFEEMFTKLADDMTFSTQVLNRLKELVESSQFTEATQIIAALTPSLNGENDETA
jgi:hypothetical protein